MTLQGYVNAILKKHIISIIHNLFQNKGQVQKTSCIQILALQLTSYMTTGKILIPSVPVSSFVK